MNSDDIDWLVSYVDAFMKWDVLGDFLIIKDVLIFNKLKERNGYK